jgi:hypothetical protein
LSKEDKRVSTYAKILSKDWKMFDILDLSVEVAKHPSFQKNIFKECTMYNNSVFAKVAGKGRIVEFLQPPKVAEFPKISSVVHVFATDGSLKKLPEKKFLGAYSVVDSFGNFFVERMTTAERTSSTFFELLALKKLFKSLSQANLCECTIIYIVDSISAIKLTLGLDVRNEHFDTLREIDGFRKTLCAKNVKEFFLHVRSHRNISVPLNSDADMYAGMSSWMEAPHTETEKCSPECIPMLRCQACQWNQLVNDFVKKNSATPLSLTLWQA